MPQKRTLSHGLVFDTLFIIVTKFVAILPNIATNVIFHPFVAILGSIATNLVTIMLVMTTECGSS